MICHLIVGNLAWNISKSNIFPELETENRSDGRHDRQIGNLTENESPSEVFVKKETTDVVSPNLKDEN